MTDASRPAGVLDASVVVCTHDRAQSLRLTLSSLERLRNVDDLAWEAIVVDNRSRDHTRSVVEQCARRRIIRVRRVYEGRLGLARARNAGVRAARGEIVAFTDDDVAVDPGWLRALVTAFQRHAPGAVGGKILPAWEAVPPSWLSADLHPMLSLLDRGDAVQWLREPELWGANFAVRADLFDRLGGFDERLGHRGRRLFGGEEVAFLQRVLGGGDSLLYWPEAVVWHRVPAARLTRRYFYRWSFDGGQIDGETAWVERGEVRSGGRGAPALARAVRRLWLDRARPEARFRHSLAVCQELGFALGFGLARLERRFLRAGR